MKLREYQQQCVDNIIEQAKKGVSLQVVVMATGLGKTVVFGHLPPIVKAKGKKTLILAHREELLTQAKEKLLAIDPTLRIEIEQGAKRVESEVDVVLASVPTIGRKGSKRIQKFNPDEFGLIIIDECHHATAETYKNVLEYFGVLKGKNHKKGRVLLGVTATPSRADHTGLDTIFDKIVFSYTLRQGIDNGYLSNIKAYSVDTKADISKVHTRMGDFVGKELSEAINTDERNQLVVESYKEIADNSKALVFAIDVEHTEELAKWFQKAGYRADYIIGETPSEKRAQLLKDFKDGDLQVLVNCMVLTEGYDNPSIETILMARPTKSSVAYSQMIGRGTRIHPGKEHLKLIDFVDNTGKNSIMALPSLFGMPTLKGGKGKLITELSAKAEKILEVNPDYPLESVEDWSDEGIAKIIKQVDIFAQAQLPPAVKEHSKLAWEQCKDGFRIQFPEQTYDDGTKYKESLEIKKNMLDKFEIRKVCKVEAVPSYANGFTKWKKTEDKATVQCDTIEQAFSVSDMAIEEKYPQFARMLSQDSKWRKDEPTEKQVAMLKKFRIPTPPGLTKGQASVLIGKAIEERKSKRY